MSEICKCGHSKEEHSLRWDCCFGNNYACECQKFRPVIQVNEPHRRIVHNSKEFWDEIKSMKPNRTIIYDEAYMPFDTSKRNWLSPNNFQIPMNFVIELGFLRKKNLCARCGKKMDIPDYHIQLCRNCRMIELDRYNNKQFFDRWFNK